jgi:acetyl esterase
MEQKNVIDREVVYRRDGERSWSAQVYAPAGEAGASGKMRPILVDVHGGAWSGGTRFAGQKVDRMLVEALGIVVVAIDFRIAPTDPYPAMMQDVNYGIRWVKAHAAELGGKAAGVGAIGWSSGGHMALLSAVKPYDERYAALPLEDGASNVDASLKYVVACWPPVDPYARYRFSQETRRAELVRNTEGCFFDEETMLDASVERVVSAGEAQALPPMLVIQGTKDANIPMPMIEKFAAAYQAAGGPLQLETFTDQVHGFISQPGAHTDRALELITEFVRKHSGTR